MSICGYVSCVYMGDHEWVSVCLKAPCSHWLLTCFNNKHMFLQPAPCSHWSVLLTNMCFFRQHLARAESTCAPTRTVSPRSSTATATTTVAIAPTSASFERERSSASLSWLLLSSSSVLSSLSSSWFADREKYDARECPDEMNTLVVFSRSLFCCLCVFRSFSCSHLDHIANFVSTINPSRAPWKLISGVFITIAVVAIYYDFSCIFWRSIDVFSTSSVAEWTHPCPTWLQ